MRLPLQATPTQCLPNECRRNAEGVGFASPNLTARAAICGGRKFLAGKFRILDSLLARVFDRSRSLIILNCRDESRDGGGADPLQSLSENSLFADVTAR